MTLRNRLIWMLLMTLGPLGAAVGAGLYLYVRSSLIARLDETLDARVEALAGMLESNEGELEFESSNEAMSSYQAEADSRHAAFFEVYRLRDGELDGLVFRSQSLGSRSLLGTRPVPQREMLWNADLPDDADIRVLASRMAVRSERESDPTARIAGAAPESVDALVVAAISREAVGDTLETLTIALLGAGAVLIVVGWTSLRWAISQGLRPVTDLAGQVAYIDPAGLAVRLNARQLPPEIAPIQVQMNALLARIEAAMQREKRFTTAAAHELRTPVAELRTLLEVAASRPRPAAESAQTISAALNIVERLHELVAAMLHLVRIESGREPAELTEVDLTCIIRTTIESARAIAHTRRVTFRVDVPDGLSAFCNEGLLRMALANLIGNAAEYADVDSEIHVKAARGSSDTTIRIANKAASLHGASRARIGEPLWRPDPARAKSGHLGLGISLARAALAATGCAFVILDADSDSDDFVVEVRVPSPA